MSDASPLPFPTAEEAVRRRYFAAAQQREEALCCPVDYVAEHLAVIPQEILERDYGCGDPTVYVNPGETVLDLGSGGGKACYILSQVVGPEGRVIGVDCNPEMLGLARRHQGTVAERLGYANVEFRCGMIQDLKLNLEAVERELHQRPLMSVEGLLALRSLEETLRREQPLVADESVDCVVSNCVLNLVRRDDRESLFREIHRVLRPGGRAAISDIVCDEWATEEMQQDPELWSGCISGAFREDEFLQAFERAGFHGMRIAKRQTEPWRTVQGIEFRSMTVVAHKPPRAANWERRQAVVYLGPFQHVQTDDGRVYHRGVRAAVSDGVFRMMQQPPYQGQFEPIPPRLGALELQPQPFDPNRSPVRDPRETKGAEHRLTTPAPEPGCDAGSCCC